MRPVVAIDLETEAIAPRPAYPPIPVGVAIRTARFRRYYAFGHPTGNNATREEAITAIRTAMRDAVPLFHHAGFDLDVMETHLGIPWPAEHHDTLMLAFIEDPDSPSLSLKPLAARWLKEPPTERDAVRDFVLDRRKDKDPAFAGATASNWGGYIARCPGKLIAPYAIGDVDRTWGLFRLLHPRIAADPRTRGAYARELRLTRVLIGMERRGIPVATTRLARDITKYERVIRGIEAPLLKRLKIPAAHHDAILYHYDEQDYFKWSGARFAETLIASGLLTGDLPKTEKGNDSTSAESLATVMPKDLATEFEVRSQIATCLNTFMRPWLEQGRASDGTMYARFNQVRNSDEWGKMVGARTGRISMTPNLQNVIRSDKDARVPKLRDYVVPGKRFTRLGQRDASQQELRLLAHYEDGPFKRAYLANPKQDAHNLVRGLIREATNIELARRPVKDLNFGLIYGQGLGLTAEKLGVSREEAKRFRDAHAASLPGIPALQALLKARVAAEEPIYTLGGRRYFCEPPKFFQGRWHSFEYKMLNKLIQGSAADHTKTAMINYDESGWNDEDRAPLLLQVHDELIAGLTDGTDAAEFHAVLADAFADVPVDVPMLSEGKLGDFSWHRMKKFDSLDD